MFNIHENISKSTLIPFPLRDVQILSQARYKSFSLLVGTYDNLSDVAET